MAQTQNLQLNTYGDSAADGATKFSEWRSKVAGTGSDSNMQKIDAAYGTLNAKIDTQIGNVGTQINNVSKDVGDLKSAFSDLDEQVYYKNADITFVRGQVVSGGTVNDNSQTFARTDFVYCLAGSTVNVDDETVYKFNVAFYTEASASTFVSMRATTESGVYVVPADGYIRTSIAYKSGATLSDLSITEHYVLDIRDKTLKQEIAAVGADAEEEIDGVKAHFVSSANIYNPDDAINGYTIDDTTGALTANASYMISGRINVVGLSSVAFDVGIWPSVALYAANGSFIRKKSIGTTSGTALTEGAAYLIFVGNATGYANRCTYTIVGGTTLSGYVPHMNELDKTIAANGVQISFTSGALSATTANESNNTARCRSGFINARRNSIVFNAKPATYNFAVFEFYSNRAGSMYSHNNDTTSWYANGYIVKNQDVSHVRIVVKRVDNATIYADEFAEISDAFYLIPVTQDEPKYSLPKIPDTRFICETAPYNQERDLTYDEIIAGYDALVTAHPEYVTKSTLGTDSSGDYTIYQYVFCPEVTPKLTLNYSGKDYPNNKEVLPTLILEAGVHGGERPIVKGLLNAMTMICENWQDNDILRFLRYNFRIVVNPCAVPYGYNNLTMARFNANGVNINRNFNGMDSWQYGSSEPGNENYRGSAPLSEVESQYIYNTLNANQHAILYFSYHTYGMGDVYQRCLCWAWATYVEQNAMWIAGENSLKAISENAWAKHNYPYNGGLLIGTMQASNGTGYKGGYTDNQGNAFGIPSACPEGIYQVFGDQTTQNSTDINALNTEWVIITVIEALKQLI